MNNQKIVGYSLRSQDNDSYMFPEDMSLVIRRNAQIRLKDYESGAVLELPEITALDKEQNRCPFCGYRLNFHPHNPRYKVRNKLTDISVTYDGQTIVSTKFKKFCEENKLEGIIFRGFESDKNCFQMVVTREIEFDAARRKTRFEHFCPVCKNYESVVGADPTYLSTSIPLSSGIFRTNLLFASGNEKHPLFLVSIDTKSKLEKSKLIGSEFSPAYGNEATNSDEGK